MNYPFFDAGATGIRSQLKREETKYLHAISHGAGGEEVKKIKERMIVLQAQLTRAINSVFRI